MTLYFQQLQQMVEAEEVLYLMEQGQMVVVVEVEVVIQLEELGVKEVTVERLQGQVMVWVVVAVLHKMDTPRRLVVMVEMVATEQVIL